MVRNQIPRLQISPSTNEASGWRAAVVTLTDWVNGLLGGIIQFLVAEHPRGPTPRGPVAESVTGQASAVIVKWRNESSPATVDYFAIYRADAGTAGAPTTPGFDTAKRVHVLPTGRVPRQVPVESCFTWADCDYSAADAAANLRFRYWVTAIDNEYRESTPIPMGYASI